MKSNLFYNQIHLLTGNKLNIDAANPKINIPRKYYLLFGSKHKENNVALNDVVNLTNNTLSRKEEYGDANLDKWGRFDHNKSFLVQNGLVTFKSCGIFRN